MSNFIIGVSYGSYIQSPENIFDVKKWAYVPLRILNYLNPTCGCYTLNYGEPRCIGTKEIDLCNCGGNRSLCDFY